MAEPVDSSVPGATAPESTEAPLSFGEKQANLGKAWADIYADPSRPANNLAEVALRNPAVYGRDVERLKLPDDIRAKWQELSAYSDSLATVAASRPTEWGNVHGLDRIQQLVFAGNINPDFRRSVGNMMKVSSDLFAESVKLAPGDESYFAGNVTAAEGWLAKAQQPPAA